MVTDYNSNNTVQLPQLGPPKHVVIDHNKIPGLDKPVSHNIQSNSTYNGQPPISSYSSDIINTSLLSIESPRGGDTYHRGTINRPVHPAMKSQIVFGAGPGWVADNQQQEREEAKLKWMNELGMMNICTRESLYSGHSEKKKHTAIFYQPKSGHFDLSPMVSALERFHCTKLNDYL